MSWKFQPNPVLAFLFPLFFWGTAHAQWVNFSGAAYEEFTFFMRSGTSLFIGSNFNLYRSEDNGNTRVAIRDVMPSQPSEPYFLAFAAKDGYLFAGTGYGLYRSADQGKTWERSGLEPDSGTTGWTMALLVDGPYLFALNGIKVFRSEDNGETWRESYSGEQGWANAIAASGPNLFLGTHHGALRSRDHGDTWSSIDTGLVQWPYDTEITSLVAAGPRVFAITPSYWMYVSNDAGEHWKKSDDRPENAQIAGSFTFAGPILFAGEVGKGVFASADSGASWAPFSDGLKDSSITAVSQAGEYLFVGTKRNWFARRPLSEAPTGISRPRDAEPRRVSPGRTLPISWKRGSEAGPAFGGKSRAGSGLYDASGRFHRIVIPSKRR